MYDICIIGSGPAGLTLCAELADSGKKIAILECGGLTKKPETDALRTVKNSGEIAIRPGSRERVFGGTGTTWAGLSAPLDRIDALHWPVSYDELLPFYKRAEKYGFPRLEDFGSKTLDEMHCGADFTLDSATLNEKIFIAKDPPWNFGKKLKNLLEHKNVTVHLDSTVTELVRENGRIVKAITKSTDGSTKEISAKVFVICAGGIESTRLLLLSNLGNEHDQVGRYITNHPKNSLGIIRLTKPAHNLTYLYGYLENGFAKSAGVRVSEEMQKKLGILNSYVRLEPMFPWTDSKGVAELILMMKRWSIFLDWWKRQQKKIGLRDWNETGDITYKKDSFRWSKALGAILKDFPAVSSYAFHRLFHGKKVLVKTIRLRNFMDMEARRENRIILSSEKDANGNAIPEIILNTSEKDRRSVIELHRLLGEELKARGLGVLESNLADLKPWPITSEASHHLGGTIMGVDPKTSVVNKDLKVHSLENLYISSGSVFPTSGCANPTYTICALSIRLADKLRHV